MRNKNISAYAGLPKPHRVIEPTAFMLDFMPFEERALFRNTVSRSPTFFFRGDALRPWPGFTRVTSKTPSARAPIYIQNQSAQYVRNLFRGPASNKYLAIPHRDRTRPPVSRWEIQAAEKRLRGWTALKLMSHALVVFADAEAATFRGRSFIQTSEATNGSTLARRISQFPARANAGTTGLKSRMTAANRA